ncbi:hypothetical protein AB0G26_05160 [Streptomyces fradiae]|uniref:Uncharacterized protein n=1 Tax=Streptomyces fradiae ATCC 10745 = DSM 40063 TaxID=1319510 RepID=A0ABQ6Y117_STRFR|nr:MULTISPECIES: hypothetical protein [Streptomyces]KAF0651691.1 hypothetical protein K701_01795 [Streptomyces fradiae ATCC 10745 = DSM 40063]
MGADGVASGINPAGGNLSKEGIDAGPSLSLSFAESRLSYSKIRRLCSVPSAGSITSRTARAPWRENRSTM